MGGYRKAIATINMYCAKLTLYTLPMCLHLSARQVHYNSQAACL